MSFGRLGLDGVVRAGNSVELLTCSGLVWVVLSVVLVAEACRALSKRSLCWSTDRY